MIPFITCETCPLSVCVRVSSWCQYIWFGSWGPNWFYQKTNQEQLCGFWKHVSFWGFFPLWSSGSLLPCLQRYTTKLPYERECTFEEIKSTLCWSSIIPGIFFRVESLWGAARTRFVHGSPRSLWLWVVFPRTATIKSHKSSAGIPSNLNPASKEWFLILLDCAKLKFVSYTSSKLEQTYDFQKCTMFHLMLISNPQDLCKIGVLNQSQSALFGSVSHMAILFVFTCMMNVRDPTT